MLEIIIKNIVELTENSEITNKINEEADLIYDIGLDSLQLISLFLAIEDEFNIEIDFEEFDFNEVNTIKKLMDYIEAKTHYEK